MKIKENLLLLIFLTSLSCSSGEKESQASESEYLDGIASLDRGFQDLLIQIEPESDYISQAQKNITNLNFDDMSTHGIIHSYVKSEISYNSINNLNELVRITILLNSDFTLKFIDFSHQKTSDQGVKQFCITSILQFIENMKININNLEKYLTIITAQQPEMQKKILSKFTDVKTIVDIISSEVSYEGNLETTLNDQTRANKQIVKIKNTFQNNIKNLSSELDSLSFEIAEVSKHYIQ